MFNAFHELSDEKEIYLACSILALEAAVSEKSVPVVL